MMLSRFAVRRGETLIFEYEPEALCARQMYFHI